MINVTRSSGMPQSIRTRLRPVVKNVTRRQKYVMASGKSTNEYSSLLVEAMQNLIIPPRLGIF